MFVCLLVVVVLFIFIYYCYYHYRKKNVELFPPKKRLHFNRLLLQNPLIQREIYDMLKNSNVRFLSKDHIRFDTIEIVNDGGGEHLRIKFHLFTHGGWNAPNKVIVFTKHHGQPGKLTIANSVPMAQKIPSIANPIAQKIPSISDVSDAATDEDKLFASL